MNAPEPVGLTATSAPSCYRYGDIVDYLRETSGEGAVEMWRAWFNGQTGALGDNGDLLVYAGDWERYQAGILRVMD